MKKCFFAIAVAFAGLLSVSCANEGMKPEFNLQAKCGYVNLNVLDTDLLSKASSDTTSLEYEKVVKNVQILVFDETDQLICYHDAGTSMSNITLYVAEGSRDVWAVVNGPSLTSITKKSQLKEFALELGEYHDLTGKEGFVMTGNAEVTVSSLAPATANIIAERLVSRVRLAKVSNELPVAYSSLTVESVFLSNVVGNQNLSGTAEASVWYNKMGTVNGIQDNVIDGENYMAEQEAYTFEGTDKSLDNGAEYTPGHLFYGFPNLVTNDVDGWTDPFTARKTRLVVAARIDGMLYYYPVVLAQGMERNKTYDVELTIVGLGSSTPYEEIAKDSISASITVKGWTPGDMYVESI